MTTNIRVRINPVIATYYGNTVDIPNMPDCPGIWVITEDTYNFWLGIIKGDLKRELDLAAYGDEPYWDMIAAYRRQIATFEKHTRTEQPIAEPAGRQAMLDKRAADNAAWIAYCEKVGY